MILTGGTIRTLDPQLPTARALATAGEWIAGGVGVHETALASPETIDLGGRCVVPGFNDSHVHFPTWAVAQGQVRLEGARTLEEAVAVVAGALEHGPRDRMLRGLG
ncbi:MAG TPA: amidohydrolase family protein, partial [Gaiellaceae bacterium]